MSLSITQRVVSNDWTSETNPTNWNKSCILDVVKIEVDIESTNDMEGAEIFFNPALFRDAGTPYTGSTRPTKGFYGTVPVGQWASNNLVPTGIAASNTNYITARVTRLPAGPEHFRITYEFRMLADRGDFITGATMDNADLLLKNSINNPTQLDNNTSIGSVYNKTKELQLYIYTKETTSSTEETILIRQNFTATFYNENTPFSWGTNDYCPITAPNDFTFAFSPSQTGLHATYKQILFESNGDNTTDYKTDLSFAEVDNNGMTSTGDTYTFHFYDYQQNYYTAVVYSHLGVSYAHIEDELVAECLPEQCEVGIHGHIKDYMGGTSGTAAPPETGVIDSENAQMICGDWWTPEERRTYNVSFEGGKSFLRDPGDCTNGNTPFYSGVFPVDGRINFYWNGLLAGSYIAAASPVGIFQFQHDPDPALMAINFMNQINAFMASSFIATIDPVDPRVVLIEIIAIINPRNTSIYSMAYQMTAASTASGNLYASVQGANLSQLQIIDFTGTYTYTLITYNDVPSRNDLAAIEAYILANTNYIPVVVGSTIKLQMQPSTYDPVDVANSYMTLSRWLTGAGASTTSAFSGGGNINEDNTIQTVSERLVATAIIPKSTYDTCASTKDHFNDIATDLRNIQIEIGGETFQAGRYSSTGGGGWTYNNANLQIEETATEVIARFYFRGLFPNSQGITDWSGTTQEIKWTFKFQYTDPYQYARFAEYTQQVQFKEYDGISTTDPDLLQNLLITDITTGDTLNHLCDVDKAKVTVQLDVGVVGTYKIVVLIDPEPYGVTLSSEQGLEEEDKWTGPGGLEVLATEKVEITNEDLNLATFEVDTTKLNNQRYRVTAIAYKQ